MKFEENLYLGNRTGGLNTKQRPNKIKPTQSKSIISMDFDADSMRRAKGYTLFGTESDDTLTGKTLYRHTILAGQDVLVKTIGTFMKFYDDVDDAWYKMTDSTFTGDLRWSFFSFNGFLYGDNGTDDWVFWKGGVRSTLNGAVLAGAITIDLQVGHGARFPASGSIMIQDDVIAYTGVSGDQLTGVTGALAHPSGSTVILKVDSTTYSSLAQANQIVFFRNRSFMIDKEVPTIVRHSKLADNSNPETDLVDYAINGGISGDAGFGIAPEEIISLQVIITGNSTVILAAFCKDGNVYSFAVTDGTATTVNAFIPVRTMGTYPQARQLTCVVENDIAFIDRLGHTRTLAYGDVNTPLQVQTISQLIEPSLELVDFTNGAMAYSNRKLYQTGTSLGQSSNDITFYHDENYTAWGAYGHWDCVDFAPYNDELYGLSAVTGNVWKLNDGYNANGGTYYSEDHTGDLTWGKPHDYKSALKGRISGFITSNCNSYLDLFFDNSAIPITFLINGDNSNILGNVPNVSVGEVVFGQGVYGGGLPAGTVRKEFYAQFNLNDIPHFLKASIRTRIDDQDVDFEVNDFTVWAKLEGSNVWIETKVLQRI